MANSRIYLGDLNQDDRDEVIVYKPTSATVRVYSISHNLSQISLHYTSSWGSGRQIYVVDLDGDGRDDVFRYNPTDGQVVVTTFSDTLNVAMNHYTANWESEWTPYLSNKSPYRNY